MEQTNDYSSYSMADLISARKNIDSSQHPEQAKVLDELIEQRNQLAGSSHRIANNKITRFDQVRFHGNSKEFFSIWIVNLLLTIVTLGIYSAWAKVRTNRYLFANTEVDGHRFSYLADPIQILKGRIIAVILIGGYTISSQLSPAVFGGLTILMLFVTPFLINMSVRFNMRMTGYRNVRFGFDGDYWGAFSRFVLFPFLSIFTLYLAMPWALKKMDEYILDRTRYGRKAFRSDLETSNYYGASLGAVVIATAIGFIIFYGFGLSLNVDPAANQAMEFQWSSLMLPLAYLLIYVIAAAFYTVVVRNHIFANTSLGDAAKFKSSASFFQFAFIQLTNLLALVCTLGLAMPWAKIRMAKYLASVTEVAVTEKIESVIVQGDDQASALSDEVANAFDVDIALG